ncbi:signal transduction histidine kinase [Onishia taeanensis]|uniref:histidine kinase n=1 Tax=Onishia taeanensis TaxID=284577 RepID=A0A328XPP2_9GAMM|nr:HAMP domain-containing sensor histidine kinase [Halomonas taeanensis]RAR61434.1 signal transduction histidine kinase [Halomonas taeanensis]
MFRPDKSATAEADRSEKGRRFSQTLLFKMSLRMGVVAAIFFVIQVAAVVWMYAHRPNELDQLLVSAEAQRIASELRQTSPGAEFSIPPDLKKPLAGNTQRAFVIHDHRGRVVGRFNDGDLRVADSPPSSFIKIRTQRETLYDHFLLSGTRRVTMNGHPLWVSVAISGQGFEPFIPIIFTEIRVHVLFPVVLITLLFLLFNYGVVKRTLKPLNDTIATVNQVDPADPSARVPSSSYSWELRALTESTNQMLERVQQSVHMLRDFSGNVAHELRTPLAIMLLTIRKLPDDEFRDSLYRDTVGMQRLVEQLLDLSQAESLTIQRDAARVNLGQVAETVVGGLVPLALSRQRFIDYSDEGASLVRGHEEAIARALRNVVENALAHTPVDTGIEVTSGPGPGFEVRDHGPGIPQASRHRVKERFYRGTGEKSDGAGLGLAIATTIVEAHGGCLEIGDADDGGALVRLMFVAQSSEEHDSQSPLMVRQGDAPKKSPDDDQHNGSGLPMA